MNKKAIRDLLVVIAILVAFPIVLRGGGKLFGIVAVAMIAVATVAMLPFCITLGFLFAGGMEIFAGISSMSKGLPDGMFTLGFGLFLFGLGLLILVFSFLLYYKSVPWVVKKYKAHVDKKAKETEGTTNESVS